MKTLKNLNIQFTSQDADNVEIWACSNIYHQFNSVELADRLNVDIDGAHQIKAFLIDQSAIAEGLNVRFWFK